MSNFIKMIILFFKKIQKYLLISKVLEAKKNS